VRRVIVDSSGQTAAGELREQAELAKVSELQRRLSTFSTSTGPSPSPISVKP
jgi:hypothetical protein